MPQLVPQKRLSRRQWAAALAALAPLPAPAQALTQHPASDLDACRDGLRRHQSAVRSARVPRETEPAFRFPA